MATPQTAGDTQSQCETQKLLFSDDDNDDDDDDGDKVNI